jgi:uncharacterized protein (DUF427 family)
MAKAPGYQRNPQHQIVEMPMAQTVSVFVADRLVAESDDVVRVVEEGCPPRYYFPRSAVHTDLLEPSDTTTRCPFKGIASYYTLNVDGERLLDAVWSYEEPYEEHRGLKQRLAFYTEKFPNMRASAS